ncbi:MAG: tetratricopeptide repeat protein [Bacteroidetes bacterium]|nr:tetratricopeptide repeat protein [Bacteroidota bacterium]
MQPRVTHTIFIFLILYSFIGLQVKCYSRNDDSVSALIAKGDQYRRILPDSALAFYRQALDIAYDILDNIHHQNDKDLSHETGIKIIRAETQIGHIYYFDCRYGLSMEHYYKALQMAETLKDTFQIAETLFNIGEVFLEKSEFENSLNYYDSALNIYLSMDSLAGAFWCYLSQGIVYKTNGQFSEALESYRHSLEIAETLNDRQGVADCYNNMGNVMKKQGRYAKAAEYFDNALRIYRELGAEMRISDCLNNVGDVYYETGQYSVALAKYTESLRIVEITGDPFRSIMRNNNMANALVALNRHDEALHHFNLALVQAEKINDRLQLSDCYTNLGRFFMIKQDTLQATAYFQKALKMASEIQDINSEVALNNLLAGCFTSQGKYILALDHAMKAMKTAKRTGIIHEEMNALYNHYRIFNALKNYSKALDYFREYTTLKDSVIALEQIRQLEELEIREMNDFLKNEIQSLENDNTSLSQVSGKKSIQVIWLLFASGALLIILIITSLAYFRLRSGSLLLKVKDENSRLKQDAEDKERELAAKTLIIQQKNELLNQTSNALESHEGQAGEAWLKNIINRIRIENSPEQWNEFEQYFNKANPDFLKKLNDEFPDLSPSERRICTFLRLDMNTREISNLTGQSLKSIEVARTRIRKKMGLSRDENLNNFINRI